MERNWEILEKALTTRGMTGLSRPQDTELLEELARNHKIEPSIVKRMGLVFGSGKVGFRLNHHHLRLALRGDEDIELHGITTIVSNLEEMTMEFMEGQEIIVEMEVNRIRGVIKWNT